MELPPSSLRLFGHTLSGTSRIYRDEFKQVLYIRVEFVLDEGPLLKSLLEYDAVGEVLVKSDEDQIGVADAKVAFINIDYKKGNGTTAIVEFWGHKQKDSVFEAVDTADRLMPSYLRSDLFGDEVDSFNFDINNNANYMYCFDEGSSLYARIVTLGRRQQSGSIFFADKITIPGPAWLVDSLYAQKRKDDRLTILVPGAEFNFYPVILEAVRPGHVNWYYDSAKRAQ